MKNWVSIPHRKEYRGKQMEFGIRSSIIQVFLKGDSMEILKSAQNLCQFDGRICRFSSSKMIHGGLQSSSEEFSIYNVDSKEIQMCPTLEVHH